MNTPKCSFFLLSAALLFLVSFSFADDLTSCANLTVMGMTWNLSSDIASWDGGTCFSITAENITLNMQGHYINGSNTTSTYGIYSNQFNTTIKNGRIENFSTEVYYNGASNGSISNITAKTTAQVSGSNGHGIYLYGNANFNTVTGSTFNSTSGYGIYLRSNSNSTITNSTGTSTSNNGIHLYISSNNSITNSNGTSTSAGHGIYIYLSSNNIITNSTGRTLIQGAGIFLSASANSNQVIDSTGISNSSADFGSGIALYSNSNNTIINFNGTSTSGYGIYLTNNAQNNSIINSSGISGAKYGLFIRDSLSNNITGGFYSSSSTTAGFHSAINITGSNFTIIRNATINSSRACINISSTSWNNSFFYNYLYNCTTYIDNANSNNTFNTSAGGVAQGNYYQNIRGLQIFDSDADGFGDSGIGYPFNASTQNGNWSGYGVDYGPIGAISGTGCGAILNRAGVTYNVTQDQTGFFGTCFNITAENVTLNMQGYCINGSNTTNTYGVYSNKFNTTIKNGRVENFSTGIYYHGASNGTISNITSFTSRYGDSTGSNGKGIMLSDSANFNQILNSNFTSNANGTAIYLYSYCNSNQIINTSANSSSANAVSLYRSSANTLNATTAYALAGSAIALGYDSFSENNTIDYSNATVPPPSASYDGISVWSRFNKILHSNSSSHYFSIRLWGSNNVVDGGHHGQTYAIYISGANNTVTNAVVHASTRGVWLNGASAKNNTILNSNLTTNMSLSTHGTDELHIGSGSIWIDGASYNSIINCSLISLNGHSIMLSDASFNTFNISYASSNRSAFNITSNAENNTIDCRGGIVGHRTNLTNAYGFYSNSYNTTLMNCRMENYSTGAFLEGARSTTIRNSTINASSTCINLSSASTSNSFFNNSLYNCTTYIDNKNETNTFNITNGTTAFGNYYENIISLDLFDFNIDGYADDGREYPLSAATKNGRWANLGADWGPIGARNISKFIISIISPADNSGDSDGNLTIIYNVSSGMNLSNCSIYINNILNQTNSSPIYPYLQYNSTVENLSSAPYNWSINCTDTRNSTNTSGNFRIAVVLLSGFGGNTTNLNNITNISNVTNLTLAIENTGQIQFTAPLDLSGGAALSNYITISSNNISVNSASLPILNVPAILNFYNLPYSNPRILKDGSPCDASACTIRSYSGGNLTFNVSGFSSYTAEETPASSNNYGESCQRSAEFIPTGAITLPESSSFQITIKNTGTCTLNDLYLSLQAPAGWGWSKKAVGALEEGQSKSISMELIPPSGAASSQYSITAVAEGAGVYETMDFTVAILGEETSLPSVSMPETKPEMPVNETEEETPTQSAEGDKAYKPAFNITPIISIQQSAVQKISETIKEKPEAGAVAIALSVLSVGAVLLAALAVYLALRFWKNKHKKEE